MGTMSASDAAPLPRLGEVFFDVRGDSRTMRVSWYADTGVAVFSIWQGDTCTGTFRLPIPELPRMIEALTQGPPGHAGPGPRDAGTGQRLADPGPPTTAMRPALGPASHAGGPGSDYRLPPRDHEEMQPGGRGDAPPAGDPRSAPGWSYGVPRDRYEDLPWQGGYDARDDGYLSLIHI